MHGNAFPSTKAKVLLAFGCVYLFWGSSFVAIRYTVQLLHPAFVAGLRYCIAGLVLLAYLIVRRANVRISRRDLVSVTGLGLLMFTFNTVLINYGSRTLSAGLTALVISTIPLFVTMLESVLPSGARTSWTGRAGIIAGFLGLFIVLRCTFQSGAPTRPVLLAFIALLTAAFAWALGSVLLRRTTFSAAPLVTTCWQMLIGGVVDILIGISLGGVRTSQWTLANSLSVLYLGIFGTLAGYTSYAYLLQRVPIAAAATYAYINPIVAVLLGWLLLAEAPSQNQWVGMLLVLISVGLVVTAKPYGPHDATDQIELSHAH